MSFNTQQADDDAILAAEAFSFGLGDRYIAARQSDIERRLNERYPNTPPRVPGEGSGTGIGVDDGSASGGTSEPTPGVG
jgi:hypothetical protein